MCFDEQIINIIFCDYEGEGPLTANQCKDFRESYLENFDYGNGLVDISDFLAALPISVPCALIEAACKDKWKAVDWDYVAIKVNNKLEKLNRDV